MGGGKGGGASQTYNYYGTLAGGLCVGPVNELVAIILNGSEVWPGGTAWPAGGVSFAVTTGQMYVFNAQTWIAQSNFTVPANPLSTDVTIPGNDSGHWIEYTYVRGSSEDHTDFSITDDVGTYYGVMTLYWGTQTQTVDPLLQAAGNDAGDLHPDYKGLCYVILKDFLFGQEIQSGPNIEIILRKKPGQTIVTGSPALILDGQCNLAAAAAEILTDPNCVGQPSTVVDSTTFNSVAAILDNNPLLTRGSILLDAATTLREVFGKLADMIDGYTRYNPTTNCIELGVFQHGVVPSSYVTLTADDFTAPPKFSTKSWQETKSRATVSFTSRQFNYQQSSEKADDPRAFAVLGQVREIQLDRPWICRPDQARLHGRESLRVLGHAQLTGTVQVRREWARSIRAGSYVFLDIDLEPGGATLYQFFRVLSRGIPKTGPMALELLAENTVAPVPWNSGAPTIIAVAQTVPAIVNYRFLEVPTVLGGQRGTVVPLVQRPNTLVAGCQLYFDTNPSGTFSLLGSFTGFAAKGVLYSNAAATDGTLTVTVDTTQPDAGFFTQSYSANDAANDTLLAFVVQLVSGGGDAGQVVESGGYQVMEICSVSTQALVVGQTNRYTLTVLRGRQNTTAQAFTSANSEVWLIPRALVVSFLHTQFDQIRAYRLAALTPAYAQFRLCPYTFVSQYPLSSATSEQFRFPLNSASAPSLTLKTPASFALTFANNTIWPLTVSVQGTWSDPDGNLVQIKCLLKKSGESSDRSVSSVTVAPTTSYAFNQSIQIENAGTYTIKLIARDSTNLTTERDIAVTVTDGGGLKVCTLPMVFDNDGNQLVNNSGVTPAIITDSPSSPFYAVVGLPQQATYFAIVPKGFVKYGPLRLFCGTPGSTVNFTYYGSTYPYLPFAAIQNGLLTSAPSSTVYADGTNQPFFYPAQATGARIVGINTNYVNQDRYFVMKVWATALGYSDSPFIYVIIPIKLDASAAGGISA